jgi:hypothetical protein
MKRSKKKFDWLKWFREKPSKIISSKVSDSSDVLDLDISKNVNKSWVQDLMKESLIQASDKIKKEALHKKPNPSKFKVEAQGLSIPPNTIPVPVYDYEYIRQLRIAETLGRPIYIPSVYERPGINPDMAITHNAEILHKYYGMSEEEIFELTGVVIGQNDINPI